MNLKILAKISYVIKYKSLFRKSLKNRIELYILNVTILYKNKYFFSNTLIHMYMYIYVLKLKNIEFFLEIKVKEHTQYVLRAFIFYKTAHNNKV